MSSNARPERPPQITSPEIAEKVIGALGRSMDDLLGVLERETALVRDGKLRAAAELADEKEEKAALYTRLMLLARDEMKTLAGYDTAGLEALRGRHEVFRAEVQVNLAVLATAHEVAEGLLRQVAAEVGSTQTPRTYGQRGALPSAAATTARGIALNRNF